MLVDRDKRVGRGERLLILQRQVSQWVIFGDCQQRTYVGSILPKFTHGAVVLTEVFASDPTVLEAVVMIRSSPLPGVYTRVVWRSFGTHWQIEVETRRMRRDLAPCFLIP